MNYFDQFIIEVQSLKIAETTFYVKDNVIYDLDEINPELHPDLPLPFQKRKYLDLRHYDQHRSNYRTELANLQQLALNEILNKSPEQIKLHLKRIEQILQRFDRLWKVFKERKLYEYYNKSGYPTIDLELNVLCYFQYDKFDTTLNHSIWFFADFTDALMFKDDVLEGFVLQIKKVLGIEPKSEPSGDMEKATPETFEELFYDENKAEPCLNILRQLQPPVIDVLNNYIGNNKGIFPLWVKVLKSGKQPLMKHFKNEVYKDLLNKKINGLELSKDASEFRKTYVRPIKAGIELDIKTLLSQISQSGILGK